MDAAKASSAEDVYEFKSVKESDTSPDVKSADNAEMDNDGSDIATITTTTTTTSTTTTTASTATTAATTVATNSQPEENTKRHFSEISSDAQEEGNNDDESRRKKRKEEVNKETKGAVAQRASAQTKSQGGKQGSGTQAKTGLSCSKSSKSYWMNSQKNYLKFCVQVVRTVKVHVQVQSQLVLVMGMMKERQI